MKIAINNTEREILLYYLWVGSHSTISPFMDYNVIEFLKIWDYISKDMDLITVSKDMSDYDIFCPLTLEHPNDLVNKSSNWSSDFT